MEDIINQNTFLTVKWPVPHDVNLWVACEFLNLHSPWKYCAVWDILGAISTSKNGRPEETIP